MRQSKSQKSAKKIKYLGHQGRATTARMAPEVAKEYQRLSKEVRARRQRLSKKGIPHEVLQVWDSLMLGFCGQAVHAESHFSLGLYEDPSDIKPQLEGLLRRDGFKVRINTAYDAEACRYWASLDWS